MSARILVVDDILPNVKLLEAKLSSEYYDVLTASNGEEALKMVAEESPDIVLLDVMMPGMDGIEVCRRIKQNPNTAHIPVVMVTALTDAQDRVRGLESGADDFLSKPVNDIALFSRVRSLVRLKMTIDEWRARNATATQLGVVDKPVNVMDEPADQASILVIEDRGFEVDKINQSLTRDAHTIMFASDGAEGMQVASSREFDLIIVSLNLTSTDGLRLASHLKSSERTRNVPIVMLGEENDLPRIAHGLEMGANDYLIRPIDRNELLARVRTQVRRKRFQDRLKASYEISLSMALTDSLTGLYNRRYFDTHVQKMIETNQANRKIMAVLILDVDKFKSVNDTHGHAVGDEVLRTFAARLKDAVRGFDLVARLGGEEFVVVLPDITPDLAYVIAERLRQSFGSRPVKCAVPGGELVVTASIGGKVISHDKTINADDAMREADEALFQAKNNGRDQTVFVGVGRLDPEKFRINERQLPGADQK
jgi:two-component system, cell cycle response regulator